MAESSLAFSTLYLKALVVFECKLNILHGNLHLLDLSGKLFLVGFILVGDVDNLDHCLVFCQFFMEWRIGGNFIWGSLNKEFLNSGHKIAYHVGMLNTCLLCRDVFDWSEFVIICPEEFLEIDPFLFGLGQAVPFPDSNVKFSSPVQNYVGGGDRLELRVGHTIDIGELHELFYSGV